MLEDLKLRVMNVAKQAQHEGLCKHKSGNFSARDDETGYVVITPTSVDRDALVVPDMIVMDLDANVIENQTGLRPTSESLMHLKIYKTRPDVKAIAHTHSMYATVCAVLNKPIPALVYEIATLNTPALAESVVAPCQEADVFLLQGHGAVAVDETSIEEAYLKVCYIEELAELYHHALTAGGREPDSFPVEELQSWEYPKEIKFPNA